MQYFIQFEVTLLRFETDVYIRKALTVLNPFFSSAWIYWADPLAIIYKACFEVNVGFFLCLQHLKYVFKIQQLSIGEATFQLQPPKTQCLENLFTIRWVYLAEYMWNCFVAMAQMSFDLFDQNNSFSCIGFCNLGKLWIDTKL